MERTPAPKVGAVVQNRARHEYWWSGLLLSFLILNIQALKHFILGGSELFSFANSL